jgi:chitin disaccharide deacetylase
MVKYLIVNADDFGASPGINDGILEAHRRGVVTSASLNVTTPWSEAAAAALPREAPGMSVGLHADLTGPAAEGTRPSAELERQLARFRELVGHPPTHLDSHRNVHRDPRLLPAFLEVARRHGIPLREHCAVRYFSNFYGQWGGETHLEQISVEGLLRILETEVGEGVTELACHPGYVDPDLRSGYAAERETELATLCDPAVRRALRERQIRLISFRDLGAPRGGGDA